MDPKERKAKSMQRLDKLYTIDGDDGLERQLVDPPITHSWLSREHEREKKTWKPGLGIIGSFITLGIGTVIILGFVVPEIQKAVDAGMAGPNDGVVKTILGIIPLMIAMTTLLTVVGMLGGSGSKEDDNGSETKEAEGIGKVKRALRGKTYPI